MTEPMFFEAAITDFDHDRKRPDTIPDGFRREQGDGGKDQPEAGIVQKKRS